MEAISIGDTRVFFPLSIRPEGNIIIDSGTTLTILPEDLYSYLEDEVAGHSRESNEFKAPSMTVHFHGADVKLESRNTFFRHNEEILCFAFALDGYYGSYGNLAQMNFLVGYDLQKHTVTLLP
ncbi:aspartic proteinase CDR1 [Prunus yedoensis var. nudiflora]|uniref:Aspartic proteinase CDR1 n=1 Tax=Prunus yedoensis var. nudiflora TaxID=2094558 RepID=A0A314YM62_PRUYE|nr:aspartic proteinase CDR1 [Prunus yedoensis var. nudiflora]PQQ07350.1 aspartic proteinase CDR1 [Prunus yedoensis var. nudiflora]